MYRIARHSDPRPRRWTTSGAGRGGRFFAAAVTAAVTMLVTGCGAGERGGTGTAAAPPTAAVTAGRVPVAGEPAAPEVPDAEPRAPLQPGETLIRVLTLNLDADDADEQVIVVRAAPATDTAAPERPIKVAVLDFDPGAAAYVRSWEALTQAGATRTFDLTLQDLLGDQRVEIVARGVNAAGARTLDAYRQMPDGTVVGYTPIIAVAARGTIELAEPELAERRQLRGSRGLPVAVVTLTEDPAADDASAMIRTTYRWDAAGGRYQAASPERVPGSAAIRDSLGELLASEGTTEYEGHLAGPWYRLVQPDPSESLMGRMEIIHFEPERRRITLFDGDVQEIYVWDVSHRLLAARLGIWVHNELVHSIERTINVEVVTGDEIRVVMRGDDQDHYFDGNYRRLDDPDRTRLADSGVVRPGLVELNLAGLYRDSTGQSIDFEAPHFTWQAGDERVSGTYTAYSLGQLVIVFKVMSAAGVTRELLTYAADYRERRRGEQLLRSLVLRPARLAITGVTGVGATALHFEQLEILDTANAQDGGAAAAAGAIVVTPAPADER